MKTDLLNEYWVASQNKDDKSVKALSEKIKRWDTKTVRTIALRAARSSKSLFQTIWFRNIAISGTVE